MRQLSRYSENLNNHLRDPIQVIVKSGLSSIFSSHSHFFKFNYNLFQSEISQINISVGINRIIDIPISTVYTVWFKNITLFSVSIFQRICL